MSSRVIGFMIFGIFTGLLGINYAARAEGDVTVGQPAQYAKVRHFKVDVNTGVRTLIKTEYLKCYIKGADDSNGHHNRVFGGFTTDINDPNICTWGSRKDAGYDWWKVMESIRTGGHGNYAPRANKHAEGAQYRHTFPVTMFQHTYSAVAQ